MAQIEDITTFRAFWRDEIVAKSNDLQAFTELEQGEALAAVKAGITSPYFVMLPPEFRTIDQRTYNNQHAIDFGFFILKDPANKGDREEIKTIQNDCFLIYKEILGRLEYLNEEKEYFGKYHATNTTCEAVSKLFGGAQAGVMVFGQFVTKDFIRHDATKWSV